MSIRPFVWIISLGLVTGLAGTGLGAPLGRQPSGPRASAYVHARVLDHVRDHGDARIIVVMGDPALPGAWSRDWRERRRAVQELTQRVKQEAPRFRVTREYEIFPFLAGTADGEALQQLAASRSVEEVQPDRRVQAALSESGPLIGQPVAETAGYDGTGVGIAVIDTGIDYTHADLGNSPTVNDYPNSKVLGGYNYVSPGAKPMDDNGHGTHVSGTAAGTGALYRGIAPGASLLALKALDSDGYGWSSDIISGIEWCVTNKDLYNIRVINLSLSDSAEWRDPADCDADVEGQAVSTAADNGIAVVAAAGNEEYTQGVGLPACASDAIAVGATWDFGPQVDTPAFFSNRGELLGVYAPGIWITAPRWPGDLYGSGEYLEAAGTSSATPHVAGAIAVLADAGVTGVAALRQRLTRTGVQIVDPSTNVATPRIDLARAIGNEPTSGPDLVVTAVTAGSTAELVGASVDLTITVKNQGDSSSAACQGLVALSANSIPSPQDRAMVTVDVPALAASETWSSGTVSGIVPATIPEQYTLVAFADSDYEVSEEDETNNGATGASFLVQALSSYVWSSTIPESMKKGEDQQVSVVMWNDGTTAWNSGDGYALVPVSPQGTDRWGVTSVPLPVSSVTSGAYATFTFTVTAPSEPGLYPCHWQMSRGGQVFGEVATGATKIRAVDDANWGQSYPAIDGSWVAFEDYSIVPGYDLALGAKNVSSGLAVTLPDDIGFTRTYDPSWGLDMPQSPYKYLEISYQWFPDISYPWVAWMTDDYPYGNPLTTTLWYFQVIAQNIGNLGVLPLRVTYQASDALFPSVDGNLVVWEDYRNDPDGMLGGIFLEDNPDIYISDLSNVSGPTDHYPPAYPLCTAPGPQFAPRISGSLVVWEDWRDIDGVQSDLYLYDLSVDSDGDGTPNWKESPKPSPDPAEIQLTDTYWPEEYPDIDGRSVVWMDLARDTGLGGVIDIYLMDVDAPTAVAVATEPATFRYHPRIGGRNVVWGDWRNGQPDIYFANTATGANIPIGGTQAEEVWPDISGDDVAYAKFRRTRVVSGWGDYDVYNVWVQDMFHDGAVGAYSFTDVTSAYWAWAYIEAAVTNGIVNGYPEGDYKPTNAVTRDQMAVFIARAMAGGDENVPAPTVDPGFTDVSTEHWAYKYIAYVFDQGVVNGYPEGDYKPGLAVNRGQMAAFIARAVAGGEAGVPEPAGDPSFPDVPADHPYYKYIEYIADAGVTQGYLDGTYRPDVVVTRDQMAVYISRAFGYLE